MCNYNKLDDAAKAEYHQRVAAAAEAFGGMNYFLQLIEALRASSPHPLTNKSSAFTFELGRISWEKVIFPDKISLLTKLLSDETKQTNLLSSPEEKNYKTTLNLVRTLKPITFKVTPANPVDGGGFSLKCFDVVDDNHTSIGLLFEVLFFCPLEQVRKILKHESKPTHA